jgi:hypothetical protein
MTGPLAFDEALPLLPLIDDDRCVLDLLKAVDLLKADPEVAVRRQDTKYRPGLDCLAGYELRSPEAECAPVLGAVAVTRSGIDGFRVDRDPELPTLAQALDPAVVAPRLAGLLPATTSGPVTATATPVRYKPGIRCVIRYEVRSAENSAVFFGKLLSGGCSAQLALVNELSGALARVPDGPLVAAVADHWPDLAVVLQAAVTPAVEVHRLATDGSVAAEQRLDALHGSGRALARLHSVTLSGAPTRSFADTLGELHDLKPTVACADPALGARYAALLAALEDGDDGRPDPDVTCHGAFRTDQLLLSADRFVLIDLDTLCRSEPARDLGNLLAYLDWKAIRRPSAAPFLTSAGKAVLDGYRQERPLPARRRLDLHRAASLVKIAGRRFRSLTVPEWPLVPQLLAVAAGLVEGKGGPP